MKSWYDIDVSAIDSPALLIDRAKVQRNIQEAIRIAGGVHRLRPHVKTHKTLEVAKMQVDAGIQKFKCATIPEAEMLGMAGARDVIIAHQPQGPRIDRICELLKTFIETKYAIILDNIKTATSIDSTLKAEGLNLSYFIDINDGHNRTGIKPADAINLFNEIDALDRLDFKGIHCYDGHVRSPSLEERQKKGKQDFEAVQELVSVLQSVTNSEFEVVVGGSPSFSVHAENEQVTCSPGTFIFWDQRYGENYGEQNFEKAAVVLSRVISKVDAYTYCLDLGHKSISSEFPFPRVKLLTPHATTQIGHSEEHLVIQSEEPDILEPGDVLMGYPYHICPTVALYDHAYVVVDGKIETTWKITSRDRKITI